MAARDLQFFNAMGGSEERLSYALGANQSIFEGEPVVVAASGLASECGDDPSTVDGIAAHRSRDVDNRAFTGGRRLTVNGVSPDQIFKTKNFATDGAGTLAVPDTTHIGDLGGLTLSGGVWYVDTGTANDILMVTGVRDVSGRDVLDPLISAGTGVYVLFKFLP